MVGQIRGHRDVVLRHLARMGFIAETDVESKLPAHAPVVLKVASKHLNTVRRADRLQLHLVRGRPAEKVVGIRKAGIRKCRGARACGRIFKARCLATGKGDTLRLLAGKIKDPLMPGEPPKCEKRG